MPYENPTPSESGKCLRCGVCGLEQLPNEKLERYENRVLEDRNVCERCLSKAQHIIQQLKYAMDWADWENMGRELREFIERMDY